MNYIEQFKSPLWQKKRLEILNRDNFTCQNCKSKDKQLHVHHYLYEKYNKIWEYEDDYLITLCDKCHMEWHEIYLNIKEYLCINNVLLEYVLRFLVVFKKMNLNQIDKFIKDCEKNILLKNEK